MYIYIYIHVIHIHIFPFICPKDIQSFREFQRPSHMVLLKHGNENQHIYAAVDCLNTPNFRQTYIHFPSKSLVNQENYGTSPSSIGKTYVYHL